MAEDNCAFCSNYEFDEEYQCYVCIVDMDEDDMAHFLQGKTRHCPFYAFNEEYRLAGKQ